MLWIKQERKAMADALELSMDTESWNALNRLISQMWALNGNLPMVSDTKTFAESLIAEVKACTQALIQKLKSSQVID